MEPIAGTGKRLLVCAHKVSRRACYGTALLFSVFLCLILCLLLPLLQTTVDLTRSFGWGEREGGPVAAPPLPRAVLSSATWDCRPKRPGSGGADSGSGGADSLFASFRESGPTWFQYFARARHGAFWSARMWLLTLPRAQKRAGGAFLTPRCACAVAWSLPWAPMDSRQRGHPTVARSIRLSERCRCQAYAGTGGGDAV